MQCFHCTYRVQHRRLKQVQTEMKTVLEVHIQILYKLFFLVGLYTSALPLAEQGAGSFTLDSLIDATLPYIHPLVAAGSNKCETLKSLFGITYEQMQVKNVTDFREKLHIDYISRNGSTKYNFTSVKRLTNLMKANARTIVILIHGFMESSDGLMVNALAPEYLRKPKTYRVLALDGRNLITLEYFRSSTYVRFMGEKLGSLLAAIIQKGVDPNRFKLIGHSLGAHIAGIAGKQVLRVSGQRVGSITALDPAGPCFTGAEPAGRLSKGDATSIDVVHTNGGILGLKEPVGDKDFYPNGGWSQPGCLLATCDHSRAWEMYAESISSVDKFPARKCENWTMFNEGKCSKNEVAYMGPNSQSGPLGTYFFTTASKSPYGMGAAGSG